MTRLSKPVIRNVFLSLFIGLWVVELSSPIPISLQKIAQMCFSVIFNSQRFGTLSGYLCAAKNIGYKIYKTAACTDRQICDMDTVLVKVDIS